MPRLSSAVLVTVFVLIAGSQALADDKDAVAILDKGIKALGGEEKLSKIKAATWKAKGRMTRPDNEGDVTYNVTVQGLDHLRQEFESDFGGNKIQGVSVIAGDKGWLKFGDRGGEMPAAAQTNMKRGLYLQVVPMTLVPLKGKDFKIETAGEEKVDGKPAVGLKVTGPDKKDFTLFFDKDSGLPVKMVAKVIPFNKSEFNEETTFANYKESNGVKRATKIVTKRDGQKFQEVEISDFKVLDKVDAKMFEEPK
jgi:hypothetical protein